MPTYDYVCPNKDCEQHNVVKELQHSIKEDRPSCEVCGTRYEVYHTAAPSVSYVGNWFTTTGKY